VRWLLPCQPANSCGPYSESKWRVNESPGVGSVRRGWLAKHRHITASVAETCLESTGTINGFNLTTGKFVGTIVNCAKKPVQINQLWAIEFGGGTANNGKANQLYFTAGPQNGKTGSFGVIVYE
jgi:hypothetical protein